MTFQTKRLGHITNISNYALEKDGKFLFNLCKQLHYHEVRILSERFQSGMETKNKKTLLPTIARQICTRALINRSMSGRARSLTHL